MKDTLKKIGSALVAFAVSPQARRLEIALALGAYEAIRASLGHA